MKKAGETLNTIFGWGIYVILICGGLCGIAFIIMNIIGGGAGSGVEAFAKTIHKGIFPRIIRITSITIGVGLVGMYFRKESALSMASDKKEAEDELKAIKAEQNK